ncbi:WxL protein peptidoglycan domain-containing protein [Planococcus beigongshangi]|uniref:WxL protein peptidoglycan domain-containing protein n=1 Tax=Planococcus beigongshangi TaxID=2782536 RepID=UPI00193B29CE|nr:DUF916 domain-containing protein [Planococcus beigongshangi]
MLFRVLVLISMMFLIPVTANAAEPVNDFQVEVLPAENQKNFSEGFFHLDSMPGETMSLKFRVMNNSSETIQLQLQSVNAHTADTGGIIYSAEAKENGIVDMAEAIDVRDSVKIKAGDSENVNVKVKIPDTASGTLLGGVLLTAEGTPDNVSLDAVNEGGSNYAAEQPGQRLVAVKVDLPQKTSAGLTVDRADFDSFNNHVAIEVKNGDAAVYETVQGTFTVMDKDGELLLNGVLSPFAMAPESKIAFPIDLNGILLEQGRYVLMIKGRADEKEFFVEEKFTVTESQAAGVITTSVDSAPPNDSESSWLIISFVLVSLLLLVPLILKLYKGNSRKTYVKLSEKNNL